MTIPPELRCYDTLRFTCCECGEGGKQKVVRGPDAVGVIDAAAEFMAHPVCRKCWRDMDWIERRHVLKVRGQLPDQIDIEDYFIP